MHSNQMCVLFSIETCSIQTKLWQLHAITFWSCDNYMIPMTTFFLFSSTYLSNFITASSRAVLASSCGVSWSQLNTQIYICIRVNQDTEYVLLLIVAMMKRQGWWHQSKESSGWKHLWHNQPEGDPTGTWTVAHTRIHTQTPASHVSTTGVLKPNSNWFHQF